MFTLHSDISGSTKPAQWTEKCHLTEGENISFVQTLPGISPKRVAISFHHVYLRVSDIPTGLFDVLNYSRLVQPHKTTMSYVRNRMGVIKY